MLRGGGLGGLALLFGPLSELAQPIAELSRGGALVLHRLLQRVEFVFQLSLRAARVTGLRPEGLQLLAVVIDLVLVVFETDLQLSEGGGCLARLRLEIAAQADVEGCRVVRH